MSLLKSSGEVSRTAFNRWADFYDSSWIINKITEGWDDYLIDLSLPEPILDLGCATGRLLRKLEKKGYKELYGIDISESCLGIAGKNTDREIVDLAQGYMETLPFKSGSFSTAVLSGVLHHLEKPSEVFDEVARVLRKKGILIICEPRFVWGPRQAINLVLEIFPVQGDRRFYSWKQIAILAERSGFLKKDLIGGFFSYILVFERC
ncbi:MAG: class I SAM-dependent methyltransferase [Candidatus Zixiibacteriota bacterium]|nr:MAG: class I SAM-dependent methyltransferase [candidate division Zixibacteria bacterium]